MQSLEISSVLLAAKSEKTLFDVLFKAILFNFVGGLGIFLMGMKFMSEGMQAIAGKGLRNLIGSITNNKLMACGVGTIVTCIVQSSSVTTVMVIGFVNGGFMTLAQAIGVIFGANIGTTITGWIIAFKIGKWGLPILGISAFIHLFSKNERLRYTAMALMGVGMIFFGLQTMSGGFKDPLVKEEITQIFSAMNGTGYMALFKCIFVGCIVTMIVQSSSATLGVTIVLAVNGVISYEIAAGLILGENVGTTITAFIASIGTTVNAKRAAYAHVIFNLTGVCLFLPWYFIYMDMITTAVQNKSLLNLVSGFMNVTDPEKINVFKIALTHSGFNIINTILLFPFMGILAKFVTKMIPDKEEKETSHLTFHDVRMLNTPALAVEQSHQELIKMGKMTEGMMTNIGEILSDNKNMDAAKKENIFKHENILDIIQKEIVEFISQVLTGNIPHEVVDIGRHQIRIADELESVSDYIQNLMKLRLRLDNNQLVIEENTLKELMDLHKHVAAYLRFVVKAACHDNAVEMDKAYKDSNYINQLMKDYRKKHLARVNEKGTTPLKSLIYTDMLAAYRKIKDHALNIAESVNDES